MHGAAIYDLICHLSGNVSARMAYAWGCTHNEKHQPDLAIFYLDRAISLEPCTSGVRRTPILPDSSRPTRW